VVMGTPDDPQRGCQRILAAVQRPVWSHFAQSLTKMFRSSGVQLDGHHRRGQCLVHELCAVGFIDRIRIQDE
jgi:hypothetical protein